jgi:hypothetical protein
MATYRCLQSGQTVTFVHQHDIDSMKGHQGYVRIDIDPREFGKLEAQVEALQSEVHALRQDIKALLEMANKSKGGMFVGMAIASVVGGIISFVATKMIR